MYKGEEDVLRLIAEKKECELESLARESGLNPDSIRRIVESLKGEGYVAVSSDEKTAILPLEEFSGYSKEKPRWATSVGFCKRFVFLFYS